MSTLSKASLRTLVYPRPETRKPVDLQACKLEVWNLNHCSLKPKLSILEPKVQTPESKPGMLADELTWDFDVSVV